MSGFFPNRWPVRWRIAAVSAGLTFLILLGFAFTVGRLAADKLEANFHEEAQSSANDIANRLQIRVNELGQRSIEARDLGLDQLVLSPESNVRLVDGEGNAAEQTADAPDLGPPTDEPTDVGEYTVASQLIPTNTLGLGPPLYVQYFRERDSLEATTGRLWFFLGGGVLGGTLLALIAGLAVADRAMRPISSLTAAAREVAMTRDPSRRLPMPDTDDEVAELSRTLDQMLRQLDAARSETEQMVQAQREFVADASHELRTPLTSILANLELLQARLADGDGDPEDEEIVVAALGSSQRMRRLVSDLLLLARADAGRSGPRRSCELTAIAEEATGEVRAVAYGHTLAVNGDPAVKVNGNPDDLHRLAVNLIENATRHTPPDTRIDVAVRREDDEAVFEVTDDGPGLPEGLGDQIFARFVRGSGPADVSGDSGTGLGLAIVRAVASSHGGSVEAGESKAGGARFTVRLPLEPSAEPAEDAAKERLLKAPAGGVRGVSRFFSDR